MRWSAIKFTKNLTILLLTLCFIYGGAALIGYAIDQEIDRQDRQVIEWLDDLAPEIRYEYINN